MMPSLKTRDLWLDWAGIETDLIFNKGVDLPDFASFPLLDKASGRDLLTRYYTDFCAIGAANTCGVILESCTWMASIVRGGQLGYDAYALDRINRAAVEIMEPFRADGVLLSGNLGPRGDAYQAGSARREDYAEYHAAQIASLADTSADMITAMTIPTVAEAAGILDASRTTRKPIVMSFVIETDGKLPDGTELMQAIAICDDMTDGAAAYFMVNCAHPDHMAPAFAAGISDRLQGAIANASRCTHAELDEAEELDDGDPKELGAQLSALRKVHAPLKIVGGCCGTDLRHITEMAKAG